MGSPVRSPYDSVEKIIAREAQFIGRPVRLVNAHQTVSGEFSVFLVIYEHDTPEIGVSVRFAVYVDGRQETGGIVGHRES